MRGADREGRSKIDEILFKPTDPDAVSREVIDEEMALFRQFQQDTASNQ